MNSSNNNNIEQKHIDASMFELVNNDGKIFDQKIDAKPVSYYKDAWRRFKKNKASLVAACIILVIILFAIFAPIFATYNLKFKDLHYKKVWPKIPGLASIGIADGTYKDEINASDYDEYIGIGIAAEDPYGKGATIEQGKASKYMPIVGEPKKISLDLGDMNLGTATNYKAKIDSYLAVGFFFKEISVEQYNEIREYEKANDIHIIYPMCRPEGGDSQKADKWYQRNKSGTAVKENGYYVPLYIKDNDGNPVFFEANESGTWGKVRILYYNYFIYENGHEPHFTIGTNDYGEDLFVRLAVGCRTSLLLAFGVAISSFIIGAIIGALEGYYGGVIDLVAERIIDILAGIPFVILATLFRFHLVDTGKASSFSALLFAYILIGWIGTATLVRRQFYRFKSQEYILAARTLGAKDRRLMFKHILPNTLGTIITSSVLVIPSVIFGESSLAYLKIIQISGADGASIGTMLFDGYAFLRTQPFIVFFPALIISLLMISFNLFGNGLRDAFNPALRGVEG